MGPGFPQGQPTQPHTSCFLSTTGLLLFILVTWICHEMTQAEKGAPHATQAQGVVAQGQGPALHILSTHLCGPGPWKHHLQRRLSFHSEKSICGDAAGWEHRQVTSDPWHRRNGTSLRQDSNERLWSGLLPILWMKFPTS